MQYLHTMLRVENLEKSLDFYCNQLGMIEFRRQENEKYRFTLVFLCAKNDQMHAREQQTPLLELTYNWPSIDGSPEVYTSGRNFGHLAYRVDDIYATCQRLMNNGVTLHRVPRDGHMAFIKSPDNVSIELLQKGKPLPTQEPWLSMADSQELV